MEEASKRSPGSRDGDAGAGPSKAARLGEAVPEAAEGAVGGLAEPVAAAPPTRRKCTHVHVFPDSWDEAAIAAYHAAPKKTPSRPAKEYSFPLDAFQATAAECLESGQSVLVAAHTSAGKTVVAQYAFAMALRDGQRAIYTSPLKALSNQKYREFTDEFGSNVGLLTGDVSINPEAPCLVMTTEVLRSMLYRGSEIVQEAALVVFDEIHYIKDPERGVVWEEAIILLPRTVRCAFLSATIPNATEFAAWVARTKGGPVSVIHTDFRPTPLQHYLFPAGGSDVHLVVDETGRFREDGFAAALACVAENAAAAAASRADRAAARNTPSRGAAALELARPKEKSDIYKLVSMLIGRNLGPVIVFAFSKREVDRLTQQMGDLDLLGPDEKAMVEGIFHNAMDGLSEEDRRLPQIGAVLPILRRGVGMHHSGMLPIVKEVIEILFQEGVLKVLFATETFSTGLNMPARSVVFTSARKFDGAAYRWLTSGEFIQMGGRAGRRGLDARGTVVLMLDERMEAPVAKDMLHGAPDPLYSAFHVTYATLLNIARRAGGGKDEQVEALAAASYRQFQAEVRLPLLQQRQELLQQRCAATLDALGGQSGGDAVQAYARLLEQRRRAVEKLRALTMQPQHAVPLLQPGRLVRVAVRPPMDREALACWAAPEDSAGDDPRVAAQLRAAESLFPTRGAHVPGPGGDVASEAAAEAAMDALSLRVEEEAAARGAGGGGREDDSVWGIVVNFERVGGGEGSKAVYAVDVLVRCEGGETAEGEAELWRSKLDAAQPSIRLLPALSTPAPLNSALRVVQLPLDQLEALGQVRLSNMSKDLRPREARAAAHASLVETSRRFDTTGGIPLMDAEEHVLKRAGEGIQSEARKLVRRIESLDTQLESHPLSGSPALPGLLGGLARLWALSRRSEGARAGVKAAKALVMKEELRGRRRVLRKLGYLDEQGVVQRKGRVAAEVAAADGLVATELLFSGAFSEMPPAQLAALVSCLIWRDKAEGGGGGGGGSAASAGAAAAKLAASRAALSEEQREAFGRLRDAARRVGRAEVECLPPGSSVDVEEYVDGFSAELMPLVSAWAKGTRFSELLQQRGQGSRMYEGSVVRAIRRIEELLRQLADGAASVGEAALQDKCTQAAALLRRDIVFAASLFL